jgi:hypothetical protein
MARSCNWWPSGATEAQILLRAHITQSKLEVRKITIWMLAEARQLRSRSGPACAELPENFHCKKQHFIGKVKKLPCALQAA